MKRMIEVFLVPMLCIFTLTGCGSEKMIGPRSESAWKQWEEDQKALVENWEETDIYAYISTIMDDMYKVNAGVVFGDDFSAEADTPEAEALRELYDDMNLGEGITPEEFLQWLDDSAMRYAVGRPCDLESIEERTEDGDGYDVRIVYYANVDSLMAVRLPVRTDADGQFTLREMIFAE